MIDDDGSYPSMVSYYEWLSTNRIFQSLKLELDTTLDYTDLMSSFIEQLSNNKNILSVNLHRNFHKIPGIFPDSRFIHLVRDPRDVANSCIGMGWAGHVYFGVDIWEAAEKEWDILKACIRKDHYLEVRYEDLVNDIEQELNKICKFIGIQYNEKMLGYTTSSTYGKPDINLCYQWKTKFTKRELQLVEGKVMQRLISYGYDLSDYPPVIPGAREKLWLKIKNTSYRNRFKINKYGFVLYLQFIIARKFPQSDWYQTCMRKINTINANNLK